MMALRSRTLNDHENTLRQDRHTMNNHRASDPGFAPMADLAIGLREVHKSYGRVHALRGVDISIEPGQFITLLGPSGSGKTTLLHIIAGFLTPDSGRLYLSGKDATLTEAHARNLGLVFQHYALFPHMTVAANIAYGLKVRKYSKAEQRSRVMECLEMVDLPEMANRRPEELSGGQRQRVALARALAFEPSIVLLDEALGALDRRLRHSLQFQIKEIQRRVGATFVHVTHDQDEALAMSDQIILMDEGMVVQSDSPTALYNEPVSEFAAMFMGETNSIPGTVIETSRDALVIDVGGALPFHIPLPSTRREGFTKSSEVVLCVRPEQMRIEGLQATAGISARLEQSVFMGDHWRHTVSLGGHPLVVRQPVGVGEPNQSPGEVSLVVNTSALHIFRRS